MTTRKEFFEEWLTALRSGEYTKIEQTYCNDEPKCYCTLGLAGHLMAKPEDEEGYWEGLERLFELFPEIDPSDKEAKMWRTISEKNDGCAWDQTPPETTPTFAEMADFLETIIKP